MAADELLNQAETALAIAVAPAPDPTDPDSLIAAARRLGRAGDQEKSRQLAIEASELALKATRDSLTRAQWYDHLVLLNQISNVLGHLGLYDQAIATIQPNDPINRLQYYRFMVGDALRNKDVDGANRLVPHAIAAANALENGTAVVQQLRMLTELVSELGDDEAARTCLEAWRSAYEQAPATGTAHDPGMRAEMQALGGDISGAFATANAAGPLVAPPSPAVAAFVAGMMFDNPRAPPTTSALAGALGQAKRMLPSLVPGPKANALSAIAVEMARAGQIEVALRAEGEIEVEPRDILAPRRDAALAAIADAQYHAGDLEGAFATALRISEPSQRFRPLLALASTTVQPSPGTR
jgi:tetratricopeptide (TPR) repeat protein